ncbi:GNAT family N-acetyltransferase [Streptomyces sp. ISL-96]|uniref:GNAT family N-acetyltransferase n=1 Tax=Streptomyces sp. ISL-96 TaxID=2819191 RepID=UPI0020356673|nr:hypothetical protein [Streptomyces sp. ISL-96]
MTDDMSIRPATAADVPRVKAVTDAAYHHYIERIGVVPVPMEADHGANVAAGRVFVTGDPVSGVLVLVPEADHLFLDSIAVHPDAHGRGVFNGWLFSAYYCIRACRCVSVGLRCSGRLGVRGGNG